MAAKHMQPAQATRWIARLLTDRNEGLLVECYSLACMDMHEIRFSCPGPSDLDGQFEEANVVFDVKTLISPNNEVDKLVDAARRTLAVPAHITWRGRYDFGKNRLGAAIRRIQTGLANVTLGKQEIEVAVPELNLCLRIAGAQCQRPALWSEGSFDPFAWAETNHLLPLAAAEQVLRSRQPIVLVFGIHPESRPMLRDLLRDLERAFARRVFVQLANCERNASEFLNDARAPCRIRDIARRIGGIFFASELATDAPRLSAYLNPNADSGREIARRHLEEICDFSLDRFDWIDDFAWDNY